MALTRYEEIAGTNHFTVIDPLTDPNSAMTARVAALANSVNQRREPSKTNSVRAKATVSAAPTATISTRMTLRGMMRAT